MRFDFWRRTSDDETYKDDGDRVPLSAPSDETMIKMAWLTGNLDALRTHLRGGAIRIFSGHESVLIRFDEEGEPVVEKERWMKVGDAA